MLGDRRGLSQPWPPYPICVKMLQILFQLELSWFWIEGNGRF